MAQESFDKEIQFLRMLALTGSAYNRQQYAQRLGISIHTFDKMMKRLKTIAGTTGPRNSRSAEGGRDMTEMVRYSYLDSSDPLLLFLFRAKSLKDSESERLSILIAAMGENSLTAMELLDAASESMPAELPLPDEKTIRGDLKYLESVGAIIKEPGPRPYRYRLWRGFAEALDYDELLDLYDFTDMMANTQLPSIQGYLLRDNLGRLLQGAGADGALLYKYHYYSRILDEAHLFNVFRAIEKRRRVSFLYFSPKRDISYTSQNTNPLYEKEAAVKRQTVLPLKVVYDHQYGRWYLLAWCGKQGIKKFRLEGVTGLQEEDAVSPAFMEEKLQLLELRIRDSWLLDTGRKVLVRAKFFKPGPGIPDFVKERVQHQGGWGVITEESIEDFIYEIEVNGILEIKPWLRSFGSSCEVLEPGQLRDELIQEWKELADYYESF
ncbi:WYL domain-containing protein [Paenibacillus oryzae]|uniref:WYL domain-containing protein n=1 Tax=Paenibacillus oryzae TaxID=1844972 RepID=A0A1A5YQT0_9BACL|nr:WYL domain-containing protein [Paenibacillus oryzae]OBR67976.1 WYL domain-containing protein [Paenibacillus oryzae]